MAAILAVLNLATTLIVDGGLDSADVVNLVLAALGVLGVAAAPSLSSTANLVPRPVAAALNRDLYGKRGG